jgi:hypothetical protein
MDYNYFVEPGEFIAHHGVKGQKWGIRRYQYANGSLTPAGYDHYGYNPSDKKQQKNYYKKIKNIAKEKPGSRGDTEKSKRAVENINKDSLNNLQESFKAYRDVDKKYQKMVDDALDDAATSDKWLQKYVNKFGDQMGLTEEQRKNKSLLTNLFDEDPIIGPELLKAIGYDTSEIENFQKENYDAYSKYIAASKQSAKELLGKYSNKSVSVAHQFGSSKGKERAEDYVARMLRYYMQTNQGVIN